MVMRPSQVKKMVSQKWFKIDVEKFPFRTLLQRPESKPLIALLGLFLISSIISPYFLTSANMTAIMGSAAVNTTAVLGMALIILMGSIDLSVGSQIGIGCMLTAISLRIYRFSIPMTIFTVIWVGSAISIINGLLIVKGKLPSFIVTLASLSAVRGAIYLYNPFNVPILDRAFLSFSEPIMRIPKIFLLPLILGGVFIFMEKRLSLFFYIRATGSNEQVVRNLGVNVDKTKILAFFIAGILYALAGMILASRLGAGYPNAGFGAELTIIAAAVVGGISLRGGRGTLFGAIVGAVLLSTIINIMTLKGLSTYWQMVVQGIIITGAAVVYRKKAEYAK
jgi:ribose transport system permease protein